MRSNSARVIGPLGQITLALERATTAFTRVAQPFLVTQLRVVFLKQKREVAEDVLPNKTREEGVKDTSES